MSDITNLFLTNGDNNIIVVGASTDEKNNNHNKWIVAAANDDDDCNFLSYFVNVFSNGNNVVVADIKDKDEDEKIVT